jgi:cytoskeletal protein CcmA (bactofilin family)
MFKKSKFDTVESARDSAAAHQATADVNSLPDLSKSKSSIGPGTSIVGKIISEGIVEILGRVEGELHASSVLITDGAEVEGNVVAQELLIGGRVKGTIHANRVKLNSTAAVEGDIFHRSLAIEEKARFEGSSRREEAVIDILAFARTSRLQPETEPAAISTTRKTNGAHQNEEHANQAAE